MHEIFKSEKIALTQQNRHQAKKEQTVTKVNTQVKHKHISNETTNKTSLQHAAKRISSPSSVLKATTPKSPTPFS